MPEPKSLITIYQFSLLKRGCHSFRNLCQAYTNWKERKRIWEFLLKNAATAGTIPQLQRFAREWQFGLIRFRLTECATHLVFSPRSNKKTWLQSFQKVRPTFVTIKKPCYYEAVLAETIRRAKTNHEQQGFIFICKRMWMPPAHILKCL